MHKDLNRWHVMEITVVPCRGPETLPKAEFFYAKGRQGNKRVVTRRFLSPDQAASTAVFLLKT